MFIEWDESFHWIISNVNLLLDFNGFVIIRYNCFYRFKFDCTLKHLPTSICWRMSSWYGHIMSLWHKACSRCWNSYYKHEEITLKYPVRFISLKISYEITSLTPYFTVTSSVCKASRAFVRCDSDFINTLSLSGPLSWWSQKSHSLYIPTAYSEFLLWNSVKNIYL